VENGEEWLLEIWAAGFLSCVIKRKKFIIFKARGLVFMK
jgi:hypothetical protein